MELGWGQEMDCGFRLNLDTLFPLPGITFHEKTKSHGKESTDW